MLTDVYSSICAVRNHTRDNTDVNSDSLHSTLSNEKQSRIKRVLAENRGTSEAS